VIQELLKRRDLEEFKQLDTYYARLKEEFKQLDT
jgi:hypothetical protein